MYCSPPRSINCVLVAFFLLVASSSAKELEPIQPIPRRLPPIGIEIEKGVRDTIQQRVDELAVKVAALSHPQKADVDVLIKAVKFALKHREIYKESQTDLLEETLKLAESRYQKLVDGEAEWTRKPLTVRGFYSKVDGSPQPYGLVIPESLAGNVGTGSAIENVAQNVAQNATKKVPLYVWLHGRGDKTTDIHFIRERLKKKGQVAPNDAIVLHPFGRQCIGYKSAGEIDVLEAVDHVVANYPVDDRRIVLMGFSMGGAGVWHIGAHYTDRFIAVSPGAGFAETAQYRNYSQDDIAAIPSYVQTLWGVYDVPNYVRNLFNVPIVCYSGEKDRQIQAARVMEAAFEAEGRQLDHEIGPGMGHKYHPDSLAAIMKKMAATASEPPPTVPNSVHLQTRTLRYPRMHWVRIDRLEKHWQDSRVDAKLEDGKVNCQTRGVTQLTIDPVPDGVSQIVIDGTALPASDKKCTFHRDPAAGSTDWRAGPFDSSGKLAKKPGLQGPIDDAFLNRFLVVVPTQKSQDPLKEQWVQFELQHLRDRWSALFRGTLPEKPANAVTEKDIRECNLILFGEMQTNQILQRVLLNLPQAVRDEGHLKMSSLPDSGTYVPQLIYPNPLNQEKYVVFNSGPTFRESHDVTNSLQNPKLPDWAIIDISQPPNGEAAGKVMTAGFFNESWQF